MPICRVSLFFVFAPADFLQKRPGLGQGQHAFGGSGPGKGAHRRGNAVLHGVGKVASSPGSQQQPADEGVPRPHGALHKALGQRRPLTVLNLVVFVQAQDAFRSVNYRPLGHAAFPEPAQGYRRPRRPRVR